MNSIDGEILVKFFKSDVLDQDCKAFGKLFNKELKDWKVLVAHIGNVDRIPSTEKNRDTYLEV